MSRDGRKLDHKALEAIRLHAVLRVREDGASPEALIDALGFHRSCIYDWLKRYDEGGLEALKAKPIPGAPVKLAVWQGNWLRQMIVEKTPLDFGYTVALWTRAIVREVLQRELGVRASDATVGRWLRAWGLSVQKPLRRAYEQDPAQVQQWLDQTYPAVQQQAHDHDAEVYFGDESGVGSTDHSGTTWGVMGDTPVVPATGQRFRLNMLAAVSPRGRLRFMLSTEHVNEEIFCDFLRCLLSRAERPIFLIVDNYKPHRSQRVKEFVAAQDGRLQLFYLPPYSPELNPDEGVWSYVKHHAVGKQIARSKDELKRQVLSRLHSLQKLPEKVKNLFKAPFVQYTLMDLEKSVI
jgi:transposase